MLNMGCKTVAFAFIAMFLVSACPAFAACPCSQNTEETASTSVATASAISDSTGSQTNAEKMAGVITALENQIEEKKQAPSNTDIAAASLSAETQVQQATAVSARTVSQLNSMIAEKKAAINRTAQSMGEQERHVYQNQSRLAVAAQALGSVNLIAGNAGPQIARIASDISSSVNQTMTLENRIRQRSMIMRIFFGGDYQAAQELGSIISQNNQKIMQIMELRRQCDCSDDVMLLLQQQINEMVSEQNRLRSMAVDERNAKGLLSPFLSLLGR